MDIILQPGDVFATENPMALGKLINLAQQFWSRDGESVYSHAGIIVDEAGTTLEALWSVRQQDLFKAYAGKQVIIARPDSSLVFKAEAIARIKKQHLSQWYPMWRLLFHMVPPMAKYMTIGGRYLVCSELVAKYEFLAGVRHPRYTGTNPDTLADEWRTWRRFRVIFEGELSGRESDGVGDV